MRFEFNYYFKENIRNDTDNRQFRAIIELLEPQKEKLLGFILGLLLIYWRNNYLLIPVQDNALIVNQIFIKMPICTKCGRKSVGSNS